MIERTAERFDLLAADSAYDASNVYTCPAGKRLTTRGTLYERSRRERKKIEMLFAHLKRIVGLRRLRLRGPTGAKDEFLLAATAQNLRKLAKLMVVTPGRLIPA